jgi:hypothetical protein
MARNLDKVTKERQSCNQAAMLTRGSLGRVEDLENAIRAVDVQYNLGGGFLVDLYQEDDWSFVIKGHALIEAAVSQLLTQHVGDTRLSGVFERLDLSNTQTGRLAFVKALDLLSENERRFVAGFSQLRNRLVHIVHNVCFRFADDLVAMDTNQRTAFLDWVTYRHPRGESLSLRAEAQNSTKHILWNSTLFFVLSCLNKTNQAKYRHDEISRALDLLAAYEGEEEEADDP